MSARATLRLLHTSDLHLGIENYGRLNPETGLSTRLQDFLTTLDQMVDYAIDQEIDLFLFCGDAYKNRDPNPTIQREFALRLARLRKAGIPVFLLIGNHDLPNAFNRATSLEIFQTLEIEGITVARMLDLHQIETPHGPLQIIALPWVTRSYLLAHDEELRTRTIDEINRQIQERVTSLIYELSSELDPRVPAVLAAHAHILNARVGAERHILLGHEYLIPLGSLNLPAFDYVALGHIHRHQALHTHPPVVYPGSSQRIDFSEEEETKGFVVVEIDPTAERLSEARTRWQFVPLPARRFVTVSVRADSEDPTATVLEALRRADIAGAVVRLQIFIHERNLPKLNENALRAALREAYYVAAFKREIERERRIRLGDGRVESLGPLEALRYFLDSRQTPADRTAALLERARLLIEEDERGEPAPL